MKKRKYEREGERERENEREIEKVNHKQVHIILFTMEISLLSNPFGTKSVQCIYHCMTIIIHTVYADII